ncbi:MAG: peptidoglycan DD-metalloendopeptidase family protein [Syntrophomonadaceae bacterium]|nr:peptidoglycan DD-metalloendopeptidase family protein [Syntrophomonadaceae bacterium]
MYKHNKLLALLVVIIFLLGAILPVYADELEDHQRQLQEVGRDITQTRSKIDSVKKHERSIMGEIQTLEKSISANERQLESTVDRIAYLEENIIKLENDIKEAQKELEDKTALLSDRLIALYEQGDISYLEVLLSATDIKDFLTRYDMVNAIVEQDVDLIETIEEQKHDLETKKSDLAVKQNELKQSYSDQIAIKDTLDEQKSKKKDVLSNVQQEKNAYLRALEELEQNSRELEVMIRRMQGGSTTQLGTGTYTWPTPGYTSITSAYGMRYHPILKVRKMHTGVDIGAPGGASIVAADSGKVIHCGWMGGYGQVIVVDHGNNMSTLYAHLSAYAVSNGAVVTKGQTIGRVGSTGWSTGPHLHFEVRINGSYTDPMPYIR